MAINPLDDALEAVDQSPQIPTVTSPDRSLAPAVQSPAPKPAAPKPTPRDDVDEYLNTYGSPQELAVRRSVFSSADTDPDRMAEAIDMSRSTGLPPTLILRNLDAIKKRQKIDDTPYAAMVRESPALASWIAEKPENAAVAHDDLENLGFLEWVATAPKRAFVQGLAQQEYGTLRSQSIMRTLTPEEQTRLDSARQSMNDGGELGAASSWFRGAITGAARNLPNIFGAMIEGAKMGVPAAVGAGTAAFVAGQIPPFTFIPDELVTVPGAMVAGFTTGMLTGGSLYTYNLESGLAYDEYLNFTDEHGQKIDPKVARFAAIGTGVLNAGLETLGLEALYKSIPGLSKLTGQASRSAVRAALRVPSVRAALADAAKDYGEVLTKETAVEVAQRAVTIMAGEIGKVSSGAKAGPAPGQPSILQDLTNEGLGAIQSFALGLMPGPAMEFMHNAVQARQAQANVEFFTALGEGVAQSKTAKRSPEAAEAFLSKSLKDSVPNVYVPTETWTQYWQSKNVDPRDMATEVTGSSTAYDDAIRTGQRLEIPTARYAVKLAGTEHNAFLKNELAREPDGMNFREAEAFEADLKKATAKTEATKQATAPDTPELRVRRAVEDQLLRNARVPASVAKAYARLFATGTFADRAGFEPTDAFYAKYGLEIERPNPTATTGPGGLGVGPEMRQAPEAAGQAPRQQAIGLVDTDPAPTLPQDTATVPVAASSELAGDRAAASSGGESGAPAAPATTSSTAETPGSAGSGSRSPVEVDRRKPGGSGANQGRRAGDAYADHLISIGVPQSSADLQVALLEAQGLPIPAPGQAEERGPFYPFTGDVDPIEQLRQYDERRATLSASGAQTEGQAGTAGAETGAGTNVPGRAAESGAPPARRRASRKRGQGGAPERGVAALPRAYAPRFVALLGAAREHGFAGTDDELADQFLGKLQEARGVSADLESSEDDLNWKALLTAVADAGGIGVDAETAMSGEVENLLQSLHAGRQTLRRYKSGPKQGEVYDKTPPRTGAGIEGAPGVFKGKGHGGHPIDIVLTSIQQEGRFQHIESLSDFISSLEDAVAIATGVQKPPASTTFDLDGILEQALEVRPDVRWWTDARDQLAAQTVEPIDLIAPNGEQQLEDAGGDTSFDVTSFDQTLFDDLEDDPALPLEQLAKPAAPETTAPPATTAAIPDELMNTRVWTDLEEWAAARAMPGQSSADVLERNGLPVNEGDFERWIYPASPETRASRSARETREAEKRASRRAELEAKRQTVLGPGESTHISGLPAGTEVRRLWRGKEVIARLERKEGHGETWALLTDKDGEPGSVMFHTGWRGLREDTQEVPGAAEDLLSTGERQPRLPGDVGAVRDAEVATKPIGTVTDEFRLTAPEETQASQTSLFQSRELERGDVATWAADLRRHTGADLARFDVTLNDAGDLALKSFVVNRGANRAGLGGAVLRALTQYADAQGKRIVVSTRATAPQQMKLFARAGFLENAGRAYDAMVDGSMYREPTAGAAFDQPFFHGSPHNVDKFSTSKVGTGQGAQSYGWGLYFAQNEDVAKSYHRELSRVRFVRPDGVGISADETQNKIEQDLMDVQGTTRRAAADAASSVINARLDGISRAQWMQWRGPSQNPELYGAAWAAADKYVTTDREGGIYKVEIPDHEVAKFLDWDAPLSEQSEAVRAALNDPKFRIDMRDDWRASGAWEHVKGRDLYNAILTYTSGGGALGYDAQEASQRLAAFGIKGLKYRDEGSRGTPQVFSPDEASKSWTVQYGRFGVEFFANEAAARARVEEMERQVTRNVVVFDDAIVELTHKDGTPVTAVERREYFQTEDQPPAAKVQTPKRRGSLRFGPDRQFTLSLLEHANLSTFLHEVGHFFFEMFGDVVDQVEQRVAPENRTREQQGLVNDYAGFLQALGVETRADVTEHHHEQAARLFEAYLREGKAPSLELQPVFTRFGLWLKKIYKSLRALNVQLTPEVTRIFDRMLASDQAIAEAEALGNVGPMFLTAEAAGMDEREFGLYRETVTEASRKARETLERKLIVDLHREETAAWKEHAADMRVEVEKEIHAQPVYRALAAMQRGTNPDGTALEEGFEPQPMKLSRAAIVERYGRERLARLPKPSVYTSDGGLDPNVVAERFGYSSGDEMLAAIEDAGPMKDVIAHETQKRMIMDQGSLLFDGTLPEQAKAAVANEARQNVVRAEIRALARLQRIVKPFVDQGKQNVAAERAERDYERRYLEAEHRLEVAIAEGYKQVEIDKLKAVVAELRQRTRGAASTIRAAIPPAEVLEGRAREVVEDTRVSNLRPDRAWAAARQASKRAVETAARQDFTAAISEKQRELFNLALFRLMTDAKQEIIDRVRATLALRSPAGRKRLGLAGQAYSDQVDQLMDRFGLAPVDPRVLARAQSLSDWVADREAEDLPVDMPRELLDEHWRTPYKELTVGQLHTVLDGIQHIVRLADIEHETLDRDAHATYTIKRDQLAATARASRPARTKLLEYTAKDTKRHTIADWFASHTKIRSIAQALDGYVQHGAFWRLIIKPLNEAADREETRKKAEAKRFMAIVDEHYTVKEQGRFSDALFIKAIGGSLSKEARLAVALNWGNEQNRARLLNDPSRKWNETQIHAILDTLDRRDWSFVTSTWRYLDRFWPEIAAKMQRVTGVEPLKVLPSIVRTKFGDYEGGYYPLVYDGRLSIRAAQHASAEKAKLVQAAAYIATTTQRGHEVARKSNVKLSVRLELSTIPHHVEQVVHDLTHHEMLIDVARLLRDPKVSSAIVDTQGPLAFQQFTRALQDVAIGTQPATNVLEKAANSLRVGSQVALLGWNFWTAVQQPLGLFNGAQVVGVKWVAKGMARWMRDAASMENTVKWIVSASSFMANRSTNGSQDLADVHAQLRRPGGWFDAMVRTVTADHLTQQHILDSYMWLISVAQRIADVPTWLGGYEKAMAAGVDEAEAIARADQAVRDSQGSGQVHDLAQIQRGGPIARLFMTFYSYPNTVLNQATVAFGRAKRFKTPAAATQFLGHMSLLYLLPAIGTVVLSGALGRRKSKDPEDVLKELAGEILSTATNGVVLLRELTGLIGDGSRGYAGPAGTRAVQQIYNLGAQVKQHEVDEALIRALNQTAGTLFRYPAAQVERTIDGIMAIEDRKSENPGVILTGPPKGK